MKVKCRLFLLQKAVPRIGLLEGRLLLLDNQRSQAATTAAAAAAAASPIILRFG